MLNGRAICLGILCVLFTTSTVFAQSQSATDTIIEKIGESERRIRDHVDTKIKEVETKIETLSTKVGTLSTDVAVNKTDIGNMKEDIRDLKGAVDRIWYGILGVLGTLILSILSIVGYFLRSWWQNRDKADNVDAVNRLAEQTADQIGKLTEAQTKILERISAQAETQAETSAQITTLISAQAEILATRDVPGHPKVPSVEGLDEFTGNIRSQQHDTTETV